MQATLEHLKGMSSNSSTLFKAVDMLALSKVESLKVDMSKYDCGKDFSTLYFAGETFVQVYFYDRTDGGYRSWETKFNISIDKRLELQAAMTNYNLQLGMAQRVAVEEVKAITSLDERTYFYSSRVGDDIGYAHMKFFDRNKASEDAEKERRQSEDEHEEKETGPYGGAFADEFDFARHVGINLHR